jgi:hypothetical protein
LELELVNLPLMVIGRSYEFECSCGHCQQPNLKAKQLKTLKRQMLPWSYFIYKHVGMVVLIMLMMFASQLWQQQRNAEQLLLATPAVNDFYFVDHHAIEPESNPKYRYTVLKVVAVEGDEVKFVVGNIFKQRQGSVYSHVKADRPMIEGFFSNTVLTRNQQQLREYAQNDVIFAVRRPENLSIEGSIVIPQSMPERYVRPVNLDNQLGIALYRGEDGYYQDYIAAFNAFTRAANADDAAGQHNLAEMYRDGVGTKADITKALYWFKQAAGQGYTRATDAYAQLCGVDCEPLSLLLRIKSGRLS